MSLPIKFWLLSVATACCACSLVAYSTILRETSQRLSPKLWTSRDGLTRIPKITSDNVPTRQSNNPSKTEKRIPQKNPPNHS